MRAVAPRIGEAEPFEFEALQAGLRREFVDELHDVFPHRRLRGTESPRIAIAERVDHASVRVERREATVAQGTEPGARFDAARGGIRAEAFERRGTIVVREALRRGGREQAEVAARAEEQRAVVAVAHAGAALPGTSVRPPWSGRGDRDVGEAEFAMRESAVSGERRGRDARECRGGEGARSRPFRHRLSGDRDSSGS